MRMAMGAGRARVIRQMLTESFLLSTFGAACGVLLALWSGPALVRLISTASLPVSIDLSPNRMVLAVSAAIAVLTTLLFGLAPALTATRIQPNEALKESADAVHAAGRTRLHRGLMSAQIGVCFVLLVAAGLFLGTLKNLLAVDLGFRPEGVLIAHVDASNVDAERRTVILAQILEALRRQPGIVSAAASNLTPLSGAGWNSYATIEGHQPASRQEANSFLNAISPSYFQTISTKLSIGRDFEASDAASPVRTAIVNETLVRDFLDDADPLGRALLLGSPMAPERFEIVGVVGDTKYYSVNERPRRQIYLPIAYDQGSISYTIRYRLARKDAAALAAETIAGASPEATVQFVDLERQVEESFQRQRVTAVLAAAFGVLALLLAMVGLYGTASYLVARRRGEIGVRMALGARGPAIVWLVVRETAVTLAVGLALGVVGTLVAGRFVESLLYGARPNEPSALALPAVALIAAAGLAAFFPARRATRLDPMTVLRAE